MKIFFENNGTKEDVLAHVEWCKRRMKQATERIANYESHMAEEKSPERIKQLQDAIVEWRLEYNRCYSQLPPRG